MNIHLGKLMGNEVKSWYRHRSLEIGMIKPDNRKGSVMRGDPSQGESRL